MRLTKEESRALAFIAGMILLSVLGRWVDRPQPLRADLPMVNVDSLEAVSAAVPQKKKKPKSVPGPASERGARAVENAPKKGTPRAARAVQREPSPVDINTATAEELDALPGVGPVLAARIVAYRDSLGRFKNVDGLLGVRGVGPAMLERLRPYARVP